jgi:hypothetical protein
MAASLQGALELGQDSVAFEAMGIAFTQLAVGGG